MAETQLTHKLRNPKSYNDWMNIWTSHINDDKTYKIYPSSNWEIPINQLVSKTENGENTSFSSSIHISVNQIDDTDSIHNVTISKPITENTIAKIDGNGNLVSGPTINATATTKFLNENGQWVENGYTLSSNGTTIKLTKSDNSNTNVQFTSGTGISVTGDVANQINIKANTNAKNQAGIVTASGTNNNQKAWATNNNGEPTWRSGKVTVKEQNVELIKYVTNFIRGFYEGGPINASFVPSPSSVPERPTNLTGTGSSYLFLISGTLGASDADYKMVFNTQKALYDNDNDSSVHLNITENDVTKNVTYE